MRKINKILLPTGLILSCAVSIWHFFIPAMFQWFSYIPEAPQSLVVSIVWTNFFFSLLLTGLSLLLLIFRRQISLSNKPVLWIYVFLVFVWLCRVTITVLMPMQGYDALFWGSFSSFLVIFTMLALPLIAVFRKTG